MRTDNCYIRRKTETFEVNLIFAIREKFPLSRLSGVNGDRYRWLILDGPIRKMEPVDTPEEAWALCWCKVQGIKAIPDGMLEQMRGSKR